MYEPFYADFGPLNLGLTYRFCQKTQEVLQVLAPWPITFLSTAAFSNNVLFLPLLPCPACSALFFWLMLLGSLSCDGLFATTVSSGEQLN